MAKRETKETYSDIKNQQKDASSDYDSIGGKIDDRTGKEKSDVSSQASSLSNSYKGLGDATPQISDNGMTGLRGLATNFATTGGISDGAVSSMNNNIAGLKEIGRTGGIDAEGTARIRGNGGFDEFAKTGGLSDVDKTRLRLKGLSPISSMAQGTADELSRRRAVQGGYSPGFDASSRALRRDTARGITDASLNTELGILDRTNAGKQWGISGLSGAETNLQGLKTSNQLRGLESAQSSEAQMNNMVAQLKLQGLSTAEAIAQAQSAIEAQNVGNRIGQSNLGLSGLQGLYGDANAGYQADIDRGIGNTNNAVNADLGYLAPRTNIATTPGVGGNILKGVGAAAGIASNFIPTPKAPSSGGRGLW